MKEERENRNPQCALASRSFSFPWSLGVFIHRLPLSFLWSNCLRSHDGSSPGSREEGEMGGTPWMVSSAGSILFPAPASLLIVQCPQVAAFCILSRLFSCTWGRKAFEGLLHWTMAKSKAALCLRDPNWKQHNCLPTGAWTSCEIVIPGRTGGQ